MYVNVFTHRFVSLDSMLHCECMLQETEGKPQRAQCYCDHSAHATWKLLLVNDSVKARWMNITGRPASFPHEESPEQLRFDAARNMMEPSQHGSQVAFDS